MGDLGRETIQWLNRRKASPESPLGSSGNPEVAFVQELRHREAVEEARSLLSCVESDREQRLSLLMKQRQRYLLEPLPYSEGGRGSVTNMTQPWDASEATWNESKKKTPGRTSEARWWVLWWVLGVPLLGWLALVGDSLHG
jgi:hypothetical protein